MTGVIKMINADKGFGFIKQGVGLKDIFFHVSGVVGEVPFTSFAPGMHVDYEVGDSPKGQLAKNISVINPE